MATHTSTPNQNVKQHLKNVQSIAHTPEGKRPSIFAKAAGILRTGTRFAWHVGLGTAVSLEEKTLEITRDLAQKGESFEAKAKAGLRERATLSATKARDRAHARVAELETAMDSGVNRSLHLIGVPSRRDIVQLEQLLEEMSVTLAELTRQTQASGTGKKVS
ncbi:MAG: phasin family protein [Cellvibrionaceae bacterium]